jgi:muconolactone delta-isomerase
MQYLVTMETIEPDPLPPEQLVGLSRQVVLPTHDALLSLKAEGKILTLGVPVGSRTWLFVVDADSHKELDELLVGLPAWAITETKVTPLHTLEERAENDRRFIERLESELQQ